MVVQCLTVAGLWWRTQTRELLNKLYPAKQGQWNSQRKTRSRWKNTARTTQTQKSSLIMMKLWVPFFQLTTLWIVFYIIYMYATVVINLPFPFLYFHLQKNGFLDILHIQFIHTMKAINLTQLVLKWNDSLTDSDWLLVSHNQHRKLHKGKTFLFCSNLNVQRSVAKMKSNCMQVHEVLRNAHGATWPLPHEAA